MANDKKPTKYQQQKQEETQREFSCGTMHSSIEEAIAHAMQELGVQKGSKTKLDPYLGTMKFGDGVIVGWQTEDKQKRFRLDHDPDFQAKNAEASQKKHGVNKGTFGIHVNQENFTVTHRQKVCHPTEASLQWADTYWSKWSKEFGIRGHITGEDLQKSKNVG